ncbi:MAG TPA: NmrA/HSCARG family protein [Usitatibacter sp.]|nr:NmrA/HSCARG family protein [Usitatibacter sp.]
MEKKIIAVVGATGAQGGGLVRAIMNDPNGGFAARAITRKKDSDKAKALAKMGAEVVEADLDNTDSLKKAFAGAYGAYCVTNFWEHFSADKEQVQARNMAEAARATGLKHVIWSTLEDVRRYVPLSDNRMPTLQGKWKVPHFDGKGSSDHVWKDLGVPATLLFTSFYWDNFIYFGMGPKAGPDGTLAIGMPMGDRKLSGISAADIGACAYGIFKAGNEYIGKTVGIAGDHVSGADMAAALSKALGKKVVYHAMEPAAYRALGFPGADDLGNMFQFYRDFNDDFVAARSVEKTRKLNPKLQSFQQWLDANAKQIPLG